MAQIVLLTANDCTPCAEAQKRFEQKYAKELESGDAAIYNVDENEAAAQFAAKCNLGTGPQLIVVSENTEEDTLIAKLDVEKELPVEVPNA